MNKEELTKINEMVKEFCINSCICPDDLVMIKKLNDYIIKNYININRKIKYNNKIGLNTSYKYAYNFFDYFNPEYAKYLDKRWNDSTFFIELSKNEELATTFCLENSKAYIYLPISKTIEDAYAIVHEIIHQMKIKEASADGSFDMLCESLSLLSELLFSDYLLDNNVCDKLVNKRKLSIFYGLYDKANLVDFEYYLINKYMYNRIISNYDIRQYLNNTDYYVCKYFNSTLSNLFFDNSINIFYESRYIIGIFLATYMHDRILNNSKNIKEFVEINDYINQMDMEEIFKYLDLEFIDEDSWDLTNESYKKLFKSYKNELKNLN